MKIKELEIKKFRNLSNITLSFSEGLNAIAGQNGTSKTSILGLIGHVFTFNKNIKTLSGKKFATEFSEIFKFAYPDYDKPGDHIWNIKFNLEKDAPAISYDRKESGKTKSIRIRVRESKKGSGKIHFPVIYLGMGRLFPLTLESTIQNNSSTLTTEENKEFIDLHNEILMIIDENIKPESITTSNKSFYAPSSDNYNHLGNSAGQDNIGQIITALISFKRLRKELGTDYKGGILLIDEIDASLFPGAQIKLIEKLQKKSKELNLQIFFTTHSFEILSEVSKQDHSKIIFLDKNSGKIKPEYNIDIDNLKKELLVLGPDAIKKMIKKKYVYCEDKEAFEMLKNLLPKEILNKIEIFPTKLGANMLKEIAKKNIPDFKHSILVLDGDQNTNNLKNTIILPGKFGPDRLLFDFLQKTNPSNFPDIQAGYTKQFCFKNLSNLESTTDALRKRDKLKKWYKEQNKYWGRNSSKVWKMWIKENKKSTDLFIKEFEKNLNKY